jgi:hypothetical protein
MVIIMHGFASERTGERTISPFECGKKIDKNLPD